MKKQRIAFLDYLRVIAIFSVVMLHTSGHNWTNPTISSFQWSVLNLFDGSSRWGVAIFVMISGALFLGREVPLKKLLLRNILRIVFSLVFWSTIFAFVDYCFYHTTNTLQEMIRDIITGHYHLWFLYMIIGLYLIIPILNVIVKNIKIAFYFVVLAFVFAILIPQGNQVLNLFWGNASEIINECLSSLKLHLILGYSGYFVLGYIICHIDFGKKAEVLIYCFGIAGLVLTVGATELFNSVFGIRTGIFYESMTLNNAMVSIAIFVFSKRYLKKSFLIKNKDVMCLLSKCSFGVYLIHPFIIEGLDHVFGISTISFNLTISTPLLAVLVFCASMILSIILNQIPGFNRWLV